MSAEYIYPKIGRDPETGRLTTTVKFDYDSNPAAAVPNVLNILRTHPQGLRGRVDNLTISARGDEIKISSLDQGAVDMAGRAFSLHPHALSPGDVSPGWPGHASAMKFNAS